jgi:hypothetical protein
VQHQKALKDATAACKSAKAIATANGSKAKAAAELDAAKATAAESVAQYCTAQPLLIPKPQDLPNYLRIKQPTFEHKQRTLEKSPTT